MVNEESMAFHWLSPCQERSLFSSSGALQSLQGVRVPPSGFPTLFNWGFCIFIYFQVFDFPHVLRIRNRMLFILIRAYCIVWVGEKRQMIVNKVQLWALSQGSQLSQFARTAPVLALKVTHFRNSLVPDKPELVTVGEEEIFLYLSRFFWLV